MHGYCGLTGKTRRSGAVFATFSAKQATAVESRGSAVENDGETMEKRSIAVEKCRFAVEVGGLAVEFAGSAVGNARLAVEKDGSAVEGGSGAVGRRVDSYRLPTQAALTLLGDVTVRMRFRSRPDAQRFSGPVPVGWAA